MHARRPTATASIPLSTAAFAMGGDRAPHFTARLNGYEAMTIRSDDTVLFTPGFPRANA